MKGVRLSRDVPAYPRTLTVVHFDDGAVHLVARDPRPDGETIAGLTRDQADDLARALLRRPDEA